MNSISNIAKSEQEAEAENETLKQFRDITNKDAHAKVHEKLSTLKRGINKVESPADYLQLDGRELTASLLQNIFRGTFEFLNNEEINILYIDGGNGDVIDWFYTKEKIVSRKKVYMHLIEPNQKSVSCDEKIKNTLLYLGKCYTGKVQDYYRPSQKPPTKLRETFDFINFTHAIHNLTDYSDKGADPYADIIDFVKYFYGLLRTGSAMFIAYYDASSEFSYINIEYYKDRLHDLVTVENANKAIDAREKLLYEGEILQVLNREESATKAKLESHKISSSYYAKTLADLAVIGLGSDLLKPNNERFDSNKLDYLLTNIRDSATKEVGKGERRKYGLSRAERGREALWKVECPLVICVIRKEVA
ncbi:3496_t:CDS:2 [Acaulospora colombiana]|uniref:3496_t:CDS:1 n=1 Tax=Acaulospora colombiana TaxID=27376 RepID=A0ACA9LMP1_9GLOM|nr:3496_t:CDS:2 [Acaulospora colombiana]